MKREAEVNWTQEKAKEFCNNFIKQSQTYKACSRVPSLSPDSLIENCVLDIMVCFFLSYNYVFDIKMVQKFKSAKLTRKLPNVLSRY